MERNTEHPLNSELALRVAELTGKPIKRATLDRVTPELAAAHSTVIATAELEDALLADISEGDFAQTKVPTDNCTNLIWVTGGGLADGTRPEHAVAFGLSRALMFEQPSLRFFVVDVDAASVFSETTARQVAGVVKQALNGEEPDIEFVQGSHGGPLQVSRFVPDDSMNSTFRQRQPDAAETLEMTLGEAHPCYLSLAGPAAANMSTPLAFMKDISQTSEGGENGDLGEEDVEVRVFAVGLHARDLRAMTGETSDGDGDTQPHTVTSQYAGEVVRTGSAVSVLASGNLVLVMAPRRCATLERVPASSCRCLNNGEDLATMASIPLPASTALHALRDRARLQPGEAVLVCYHDGDAHGRDRSGPAAVRIARALSAQVVALAVVDDADISEEQRRLVARDLDLPEEQVLPAQVGGDGQDASAAVLSHGLLQVIVNFCGDRWPLGSVAAACADDARIVHVGRGAVLGDLVATDPAVLRKNVAMSTFDVSGLFMASSSSPSMTRGSLLLDDVLSLWRQGKLTGMPGSHPRVFEIADLAGAFRAAAGTTTSTGARDCSPPPRGAISVSLEDEGSLVQVAPPSYHCVFSPNKSYLLVGCLGGLGRSLSRWMFSRGARRLVFSGRSCTDRKPAWQLVQDPELSGAAVTVVRGDVVSADDVERAVAASVAVGPLGGVIQAAMGLDEALFTTMPADYWHKGLEPKMRGSRNLHQALAAGGRDADLDFFLMTSSVSGSVGTATESNYCTANYFLDVFARYRLGLPATSVGLGMISEVGYLHENPEIEAMLLRKGIQAISEDEMLHIIDISLSTSMAKDAPGTSWGGDHALAADKSSGGPSLGGGGSGGLPAGLAQAVSGASSPAVAKEALELIANKFSNLVLVPRDRLDLARPLSDVGVDSMLAAEFRGWIYQHVKVDVPYLTMLASTTALTMLSELIAGKLLQK